MVVRWLSVLTAASVLSLSALTPAPAFAQSPPFADGWPPRQSDAPLTASTGTFRPIDPYQDVRTTTEVVPDSYIVQLEPGSTLVGRGVHDTSGHDRFHRRAKEENIRYKVREKFTSPSVFYGVSVTLTDNKTTPEMLSALPEVKKVWPVVFVPQPHPISRILENAKNPAADYGFNQTVSRPKNYHMDSNLKMGNVHRLHDLGIKGKGVKVAIIDTGVDYRHPSLGSGFGRGKKFTFGANLVAGEPDPADPLTTCNSGGHGTHVAGILGGEDAEDTGFGLIGVAPEAELGMYKVFDCAGATTLDLIMQAMVMAVNDGADIISMSLGAQNDWQANNPLNDMITAITDLNTLVVASVGNDGVFGPFSASFPAISTYAIAVASFDSPHYPLTYEVEGSNGAKYRYSSIWPIHAESLNVFTFPTDVPGCTWQNYVDAAAFADANGWERSETILLFTHGYCEAADKAYTAVTSFGFHSVMIYDYSAYRNPFYITYPDSLPSNPYTYAINPDGPALYQAAKADTVGFKLHFASTSFAPYLQPSAGRVSNYSAFGPTWELEDSKPTVGAPGYSILSTWPLEGGAYAIISGTSMACPYAAGVVALLKSKFPWLSARQLHNLIATSGTTLATSWADDSIVASVANQGGGLLNAWAAYSNAKSQLQVSVPSVSLGSSNKTVTHNFTLENKDSKAHKFSISHLPAGMVQWAPSGDRNNGAYGFASFVDYGKGVIKSPSSVTVQPGRSVTIEFEVTPPTDQPTAANSIYSGYIKVESGENDFNVPYVGRPYSLKDEPVLSRALSRVEFGPGGIIMPFVWTFDSDYPPSQGTPLVSIGGMREFDLNSTWIKVNYWSRLLQPWAATRFSMVKADTNFVPTYYGYDPTIKYPGGVESDMPLVEDFYGTEGVGLMLSYGPGVPGIWESVYSGYLATTNNTMLPYGLSNGDYRWLTRILKVGGDWNNPEDQESWLSGIVRVIDHVPFPYPDFPEG